MKGCEVSVQSTRWIAWVDLGGEGDGHRSDRVRRYVTHGVPFLQLTPFRSAAARYRARDVAESIASIAAGSSCPHGVEPAPEPLTAPSPRPPTSDGPRWSL